MATAVILNFPYESAHGSLLSQTMGEIGEIVFRSGLFDEKHMLEAASYLSFAVCGFGGLPRDAAQSVPRFAIIPLSVETGFFNLKHMDGFCFLNC